MRLYRKNHEWGSELTGFGRPFGLGFNLKSHLIVTDMDTHAIVKFNEDMSAYSIHNGGESWGDELPVKDGLTRHRPKFRPTHWNGPHSVVSDLRDRLFICCYYRPQVVILQSNGKPTEGISSKILEGPATASIDHAGRLFVAEYAKNLVLKFTLDGNYLGRLGRSEKGELYKYDCGIGAVPCSSKPGGFDRPHMALGLRDSSLIVADTWNDRLQRFSADGEILPWVGKDVSRPVSVDQDDMGRILVTCWGGNELVLFESSGVSLRLKGIPLLKRPYDARFYRQGIIVADSLNGRVLVIDKLNEDVS